MQSQFSLMSRPFDAQADVERVVAWAGLDRPSFLDPNNRDLIASSCAFLASAAGGDEYTALTLPRGAGVQGPIAALRQRFGERAQVVYVDPDFRDGALARSIEQLIDSSAALRGTPRLAAA